MSAASRVAERVARACDLCELACTAPCRLLAAPVARAAHVQVAIADEDYVTAAQIRDHPWMRLHADIEMHK
jgi:hypothetical protein